MSGWLLATLGLVPPFAIAVFSAARGPASRRLIGLQLATSIATIILILLTFVFDQSSLIDLALALVMLGLPGTLLAAFFLERWL